MKLQEENERLRQENERLRSELAKAQADVVELRGLVDMLVERVKELEARLAQDSHNSNWPSSRDKGRRQTKSLRQKSGKKPGGQAGHSGKTLEMVVEADQLVTHRPKQCEACGHGLAEVGAEAGELQRRQVFDLPPLQLEVTEHRVETVVCPGCRKRNVGAFPEMVSQAAQYGPHLKGLCVYLHQQHLLPLGRVSEVVNELFKCSVSPGSIVTWLQVASQTVTPLVETIKTALQGADVLHCDETGFYVQGKRQWLHVAATPLLTYYYPHAQRGNNGILGMGILSAFSGTAVHDGWAPYAAYRCRHALCNAHHLRELTYIFEEFQQEWAQAMIRLLLDSKAEVEQARQQGLTALPPSRRQAIDHAYQAIIAQALAANPQPPSGWPSGKRGRPKRPKPLNLADRLDLLRLQVLAFLDDFRIPFDNNLVERDIRMVKVQQKISGCFRSWTGAQAACTLRSYLSTLRKQGFHPWLALSRLFAFPLLVPSTSTAE